MLWDTLHSRLACAARAHALDLAPCATPSPSPIPQYIAYRARTTALPWNTSHGTITEEKRAGIYGEVRREGGVRGVCAGGHEA